MKTLLRTFACLLAAAATAQDRPPELILPPPPPNVITKPMKLARVETDVKISGLIADTSVQMTFANPNDRVLEGNLYVPLPEGATICGYALDIEGVMVDGVAVEKEKARVAFEKEVRKGVDPGLVEWSGGNHFKTRVYPIPARGSRTIRVRYLTELLPEAGSALFRLPLKYRQTVDEFSLRVEVLKSTVKPEVRGGDLANFSFAAWNDSFVAETVEKKKALTNDLVVAVPDVERRAVAVETNRNREAWFCIQDLAKVAPSVQTESPHSIGLLWDASGSRNDSAARAREIALLEKYLATLKGKVAVRLQVFRHLAGDVQTFKVSGGQADDLIAALKALDYDGGTQFGAVVPFKDDQPDLYLVFADGVSNFGESKPGTFEVPLFVFSADAAAEHARLRALATASGGEFFNLTSLTDEAVLPRIGRTGFGFIRAKFDPEKITACHPASPRPVVGRFAFAGKLLADEADVTLEYGVAGKVTAKKTFTIRRADATASGALRPYWAQKRLDDLLVDPEGNEGDITALGRSHGLVTPNTSLLVLDTIGQYVEHRVRPPASLPKMQKQYDQQIAAADKGKRLSDESKIDRVLKRWNDRVAWWEKEFKYPKGFKFKDRDGDRPHPGVALGGVAIVAESAPSASVADPVADASIIPPAAPAPVASRPAATAARLTIVRGGEVAAKAMKDDGDGGDGPTIDVKPWDPKTPYLTALKAAKDGDVWKVYLQQRVKHGRAPAFFVDCAAFFADRKDKARAIQVLSNVAELELENAALVRVMAYRLMQMGEFDPAIAAFEEAKKLRGEEPQSYRDLALALSRRAEADLKAHGTSAEVRDDLRRAGELLYHVVLNTWDRFEEIELTALVELNRLLPIAKQAGVKDLKVDSRLVKPLDLDVRIVMTWDADLTDMDLWVTEPSGEKAMYNHNRTTIGGLVSKDFTQGYGPEEYLLRRAMKGPYKIESNFYGSNAQQLIGSVTLQVEVFTNYGRETERCETLTLRLSERKETFKVGEITWAGTN